MAEHDVRVDLPPRGDVLWLRIRAPDVVDSVAERGDGGERGTAVEGEECVDASA